jgi:hypothetical protein
MSLPVNTSTDWSAQSTLDGRVRAALVAYKLQSHPQTMHIGARSYDAQAYWKRENNVR